MGTQGTASGRLSRALAGGYHLTEKKTSVDHPEGRPADLHHCLPDYLQPGLKVVFVGFNPGERSARIGHYYAGRGNQFWNFLHESGLAPEKLRPEDDHRILEFQLGLTDVVKRWSRSSGSLRAIDYRDSIPPLIAKLRQVQPRAVAFNGKGAYERVSGRFASLGLQRKKLEGAHVFVLPSHRARKDQT